MILALLQILGYIAIVMGGVLLLALIELLLLAKFEIDEKIKKLFRHSK